MGEPSDHRCAIAREKDEQSTDFKEHTTYLIKLSIFIAAISRGGRPAERSDIRVLLKDRNRPPQREESAPGGGSGEQGTDRFPIDWPGKEVALCQSTAEGEKLAELRLGLYPLGDHLDAEVAGEGQNGAQDLRALPLLAHLGNEGAVDLQTVDGEALETGERGVAGAEVVDRDPHAQRLHAVPGLDRDVEVPHHDALGDLEHQVSSLHLCPGESRPHPI